MEHCPWFGAGLRTTMAEELVHGTAAGRRRCFYDEEGNDVRLSAPGVRWNDLRKIRRDVLENLRRNCQEAFDKIYDQMVDERRVSMNQHVLPMIKTPGISRKAKSCTRPAQKSSPPPSPLSPPNATSNAAPTHTCSSVTQKIHNSVMEPVDEGFSPDHDTANNAITKPRNNSCRSVGENGELTRLSTARETRSSARGRPPLVELSTATMRVTRSRTASNVKSKVSAQSQDTCSSVVCLAESRGGQEEAEMVDFIEERVHGKSEGEREENEKDAAGPDASTVGRSATRHNTGTDIVSSLASLLSSQRSVNSTTVSKTYHTVHSASVTMEENLPLCLSPKKACDVTRVPNKRTVTKKKLALTRARTQTLTSNELPSPVTPINDHPQTTCMTAAVSHEKVPLLPVCATPVTSLPHDVSQTNPPTKLHTALSTHRQASSDVEVTGATSHQLMQTFKADKSQENSNSTSSSCRHVTRPSFDTPEPADRQPYPTEDTLGDEKHADREPSSGAGSDSGVCSHRSSGGWREEERRGSTLGGKRLRSVSLEKLSLSDLKAKKISLDLVSKNAHDAKLGGESEDINAVMDTEVNIDDNAVSGDSEETYSPRGSTDVGNNMMSGDSHENMEASPTSVENEAPSPGSSGQTTDGSSPGEDGSSPGEDGSSPVEGVAATTSPTHLQSHTQTTADTSAGFGKSPVVNLKKTKASQWALFFHKTHFHDVPALLPTQNRPATFLSPKKLEGAGKLPNGSALPPSFLAKSSPQQIMKAETKAARQRKLMEHMQRKKEEEEQRMRELDEKRNQEIEQRKKRNVERAQRAAERRRLDEEKKLMQHKKTQDLVNEEMSKKQLKLSLWKANERQEKSKKHNERVAAVLARKKQEEEQKAKKIQQLEEDRKMAEELHKQRLEKEEDERQARRAEKMRQEKERQQLKEAEQREWQANGELPQDKPESNIIENAKNTSKPPPKHTFQQLLASTCMVTIPATSVHPNTKQDHKPHHGTATVTKSHPTLPITTHNISLEQCPPPHPITPGCGTTDKENVCPQASSDLNSTFTVDVSAEVNGKDVVVTPLKSSIHTSSPSGDSYKMTPTEPRFSNYDIDDLSSGDSTDEEDRPKKPIPTWAATAKLRDTMFSQEARVQDCTIDPCDIFPSIELLRGVDLARIFKLKRKRFYHRSSSGRWDSPVLLKKGKIDNLKMDNFSVQLV